MSNKIARGASTVLLGGVVLGAEAILPGMLLFPINKELQRVTTRTNPQTETQRLNRDILHATLARNLDFIRAVTAAGIVVTELAPVVTRETLPILEAISRQLPDDLTVPTAGLALLGYGLSYWIMDLRLKTIIDRDED